MRLLSLLVIAEALATASTSTIPAFAPKNSQFLSRTQIDIERASNVGGGTVWTASLNGRSSANRQDFITDGAAVNYQTRIPFAALSNYNWVIRVAKGPRTGTVAVTANSNVITGTGTQFLTELAVGKTIRIGDQVRRIATITSATAATSDDVFEVAATGVAISLDDEILVQTTDYTVSNVGGFALITLGAAAKGPAGSIMEVHFVVPVAKLTFATATTTFLRRDIDGGELFWYVSDATASPGATNIYARPMGL